MHTAGSASDHRRLRAGFSIVELLVVIIIIAVVISILFPALAGARSASRKASSLSLMSNVAAAAGQFINDKRTPPGYFSAADMGHSENATTTGSSGSGFSGMQNVMLDLAGGITTQSPDNVNVFSVGPRAGSVVSVDIGQIGGGTSASASKAYLNPDRSFMEAQNTVEKQDGDGSTLNLANAKIPSLVDAFGQPILAWSADDRVANVTWTSANDTNFAGVSSDTSANPARYWWNANGCFLNARNLGRLGKNQRWDGDITYKTDASLLAGAYAANLPRTMAGVLGNPSFPLKTASNNPSAVPAPAQGRGQVVFHSAGANGLYVGASELGGKKARGVAPFGTIKFDPAEDVIRDFDDLMVSAGG